MCGYKRTILFLLLVFLAGCSGSVASVEGKWQSSITPEITIEFVDGGELREYWEHELNTSYSYEQDGDKVTVDQNGDKYTLTLDGDKLVYNDEVLYTRIK